MDPSLQRLRWLSDLEDTLLLGAAALDGDGRISSCSDGFERLLAARAGAPLTDLVAPAHREPLRAALAAVHAGEPERLVRVADAASGRSIELRLRRPAEPGGPIAVVARDRVDLDRIERHLLLSERLRLVGEMMLGCAHELNNLLGVICHVAESDRPPEPGDLELLRRCADDARGLVQRLHGFARSDDAGAQAGDVVDPCEVLRDALEFTRVRWQREAAAAGIRIDVDADLEPVGTVTGSAAQLRHAAINLIANAVDAMPRGGRLRVATRRDGADAVLEIADTGTGLPSPQHEQIFEPFFSTKGEAGLGLGLTIVADVVARHGGQLRVRSSADQGSVFEIRLPVRAGAGAPAPAVPAACARATRASRVLLVDDNHLLRRLIARTLRNDGHEVLESASAEEAETLAAEPDGVDLLVLDVSLPGRSGLELIRTLRARGCRAPALLITGWGFDIRAVEATRVLAKPFSPEALRRAIAELQSAQAS